MNESAYGENFRGHSVAATFDSPEKAEKAAEQLAKSLGSDKVEVNAKREDKSVKYAEMRDELEGVVMGPTLGSALTKSQTQGAVSGTVLIGGLGVLIGIVVGFIVHGVPGADVSVARWLLMWVLTPAIAAGTLGMLAGGLLKQRHAPAPTDSVPPREASPDAGIVPPQATVVNVTAGDGAELEKAIELLQQFDPKRVDRFNAQGEVEATEDLGSRANTQR